jgi:RNase P/RNase MRP subunit POP5
MQRDEYGDPIGKMQIFHPENLDKSYNFSRAIGDFEGTGVGITSMPEINVKSLGTGDRFIIISTNYVFTKIETKVLKRLIHEKVVSKEGAEINRIIYHKFTKLTTATLTGVVRVEDSQTEAVDFGIMTIKLNTDPGFTLKKC